MSKNSHSSRIAALLAFIVNAEQYVRLVVDSANTLALLTYKVLDLERDIMVLKSYARPSNAASKLDKIFDDQGTDPKTKVN
jgi:hypothetical protein